MIYIKPLRHNTGNNQMICITIYKTPAGPYQGFQVTGHADSVEDGADLVCCSISVLTINLLNSLDSFTSDSYELIEDEEEGLIRMTFNGTPSGAADLLMRSYDLGVHSIADEYDTWLKVVTKEV